MRLGDAKIAERRNMLLHELHPQIVRGKNVVNFDLLTALKWLRVFELEKLSLGIERKLPDGMVAK